MPASLFPSTLRAQVLAGLLLPASLSAQAFDCVILNDGNTNLFIPPDSCFIPPEDPPWCDCVRSAFTRPLRGQTSGFRQVVVWVGEQPGIGNHRVEVPAGTLDLGTLREGEVIGGADVEELIPGSFPLVGGQLFTVKLRIEVTKVDAASAEFSVTVVEVSDAAKTALFSDPLDEQHSFGHLYSGQLVARGEGKGFLVEYRYATENVQDSPLRHPAIQVNEAASPTFTVPFLLEFFSTERGLYTLPDAGAVEVTTTLRRFTDQTLAEVLELGAADLCRIAGDPAPCKVSIETLGLTAAVGSNHTPRAEINVIDLTSLMLLEVPVSRETFCGRARLLLRGRNSRDNDGDVQDLRHEWFLKSGPAENFAIPELTKRFKDTHVLFSGPGEFEVGLRVDDGGATDAVDETSFTVEVSSEFDQNVPPMAVITARPDPPHVDLVNGIATVTLDGGSSTNGTPGEDDCSQELAFSWREVSAPPGATSRILTPAEAVTTVELQVPGTYRIELGVDDGGMGEHTSAAQVDVVVVGEADDPRFLRGDGDADGRLNITDAVRTLNWLFRGDETPPCLDAADTDDSGAVNITDAINLLQFLFLGGVPPEPPGQATCGPDPRADTLARCAYEEC